MQAKLTYIKNNPIPPLNFEVRVASGLDEFYTACLQPRLPKRGIVEAAHKVLVDYIKHPDAVFWIRDYASPKAKHNDPDVTDAKNYGTLRRGWLTAAPNCSYAYCDNSFSTIFYAFAFQEQFPQTAEELLAPMLNKTFPYGDPRFVDTTFESAQQAFKKSILINKEGLKLSHIYPLKEEYAFAENERAYKTVFKSLFTPGLRRDFISEEGVYVRKVQGSLTEKQKTMLAAQFMRLVHPLNHFLTPHPDYHSADRKLHKNDIGEDSEMIHFMRRKLEETYDPAMLQEFKYYAQIISEKPHSINTSVQITYGLSLKKVETKPKTFKIKSQSGSKEPNPRQPVQFIEPRALPASILAIFEEYNNYCEIELTQKAPSVGEFAKRIIGLLYADRILETHLFNLTRKDYCKDEFELNFPLFLQEGNTVKDKYYTKGAGRFVFGDKIYYLTNDWFAPTRLAPSSAHNLQALYNWSNNLYKDRKNNL